MMRFISFLFAAAFAVGASAAVDDPGAQSEPNFRAALADSSTSPYFVRFILVDPDDGSTRIVCTESGALLGAVHREFGIGYDKAGIAQVQQIAMSTPNHAFRFTTPAARRNVSVYPGDAARNDEACQIIASGRSVRRADLTGQLIVVP